MLQEYIKFIWVFYWKFLYISNFTPLKGHLTPLINKYFSLSNKIKEIIKNIERKYNINYENICVLFYRGNDKNRETFNDLRIKSANLKKINNFTISALLINRLVSFFNVVYLSDKKHKISSSIYPSIDDGVILNCNINF